MCVFMMLVMFMMFFLMRLLKVMGKCVCLVSLCIVLVMSLVLDLRVIVVFKMIIYFWG